MELHRYNEVAVPSMKTGYGDGLFYLARFWHGGYKLGLKLEYSSTSILNSVDGLSSTLAGKHLKHRRACRERERERDGGEYGTGSEE